MLTALIRNFYKLLMNDDKVEDFGLKPTSRIKSFVFRFVTVAAKWIRTSRWNILKIYSDKQAYSSIFITADG